MIKRNDIKDTSPLSLKNLNDTLRGVVYKLGGNIEYLDLGSDLKKKWDSMVTDGNLQSKIEQHPDWIRVSFNGNSNYIQFNNDNTMSFIQSDGSYFKVGVNGLQKHKSGVDHDVHYLAAVGTARVDNQQTVTITLPSDFQGKHFTVALSNKNVMSSASGSGYIHNFGVFVDSYNYAAGTFTIWAYVYAVNISLSKNPVYEPDTGITMLGYTGTDITETGLSDGYVEISYVAIA